jgi:hypothetical protein
MNVPEMTLRDWFAGQALPAVAAKGSSTAKISEDAYKIADAMLAERSKEHRPETRTPRPGS